MFFKSNNRLHFAPIVASAAVGALFIYIIFSGLNDSVGH